MGLEMLSSPTTNRHDRFAWAWSQPAVQELVKQLNDVYQYRVPLNGLEIKDSHEFQDFENLDIFVKFCPTCSRETDVPLLYDSDCYSICNQNGCTDHLVSDRAEIVDLLLRINEQVKNILINQDTNEE